MLTKFLYFCRLTNLFSNLQNPWVFISLYLPVPCPWPFVTLCSAFTFRKYITNCENDDLEISHVQKQISWKLAITNLGMWNFYCKIETKHWPFYCTNTVHIKGGNWKKRSKLDNTNETNKWRRKKNRVGQKSAIFLYNFGFWMFFKLKVDFWTFNHGS